MHSNLTSAMPYIVTTRKPYGIPASVAKAAWQPDEVSRRAVATLDEASDYVITAFENAFSGIVNVSGIDEGGGTIGPLPDGTVIAVRPTDWLELAGLANWTLDYATRQRLAGRARARDRAALLAAFNARQEA